MNKYIAKLLDKRKVKLVELTAEERAVYDSWDEKLSTNLTLETLRDFCKYQKLEIEKEFVKRDNSRDKDFILKATLSVYIAVIGIIEGEEAEKVALIKQLEDLIRE